MVKLARVQRRVPRMVRCLGAELYGEWKSWVCLASRKEDEGGGEMTAVFEISLENM